MTFYFVIAKGVKQQRKVQSDASQSDKGIKQPVTAGSKSAKATPVSSADKSIKQSPMAGIKSLKSTPTSKSSSATNKDQTTDKVIYTYHMHIFIGRNGLLDDS